MLTRSRTEITDAAARLLIDAACAKAEEIGVPENIAVVDSAGHLLAFHRMSGAKFHSIATSQAKAVTAASIGAASGHAPMEAGVVVGLTTQGAFTNLKGGFPLIIDGQIAGAIGVGSGSPDEDIAVAEAAIAALMSALG